MRQSEGEEAYSRKGCDGEGEDEKEAGHTSEKNGKRVGKIHQEIRVRGVLSWHFA